MLKTKQIGVEGAVTIEVVQERGNRLRWRWSRLCFEIEEKEKYVFSFNRNTGLAGNRFQF